ncbi:MAG: MarR family transcriptional regulator [Nocardioidaceae bacterium]
MVATGPSPLTRYTGYLLRRAYVRATGCAQACMPEDTQVREVAALSILAERGPLSQHALGTIAHVNRSLVVKLVDTLESKHWVVRERSEQDRRTYALRLTDAGRCALADVVAGLDESESALTRGLSPEETRRLQAWLILLLSDDPSVGITSLSARTGYLLAHSHRWARELAAQRLEPLGIEPRDFGLLSTLAGEQPCSQNRLAAGLGISAPGVIPMVAELEQAGLVSRARNQDDRRVYDLTLTDHGQQMLVRAQQVAAGVQEEIRGRLGAGSDEDLRALLAKLIAG